MLLACTYEYMIVIPAFVVIFPTNLSLLFAHLFAFLLFVFVFFILPYVCVCVYIYIERERERERIIFLPECLKVSKVRLNGFEH